MNTKQNRRFVYICFPETVEKKEANRYCVYAFRKGVIPISPVYLMPRFLREESQDVEKAKQKLNHYIDLCSEAWVFGNVVTPEMKAALPAVQKKNIRIRFIGGKV